MPKFYVVGYSSIEGTFPDVVAKESWQWTNQNYGHYEDAIEYYQKVLSGSAWVSKKLKAVYLAEITIDWVSGDHETIVHYKQAHPPQKVVLYNKHDIPMPEAKKVMLKNWLSQAPIPSDYFDMPPEPDHEEEDES